MTFPRPSGNYEDVSFIMESDAQDQRKRAKKGCLREIEDRKNVDMTVFRRVEGRWR